MSFLNSSSYVVDMTEGQTFSCPRKAEKNQFKCNKIDCFRPHRSYLPTSLDDLIIDVSDHHGVDDSDSKQPGQNPLQDVKPDVRAVTRQKKKQAVERKLCSDLLVDTARAFMSLPCVTQVGVIVHSGSTAVPETQNKTVSL